MSKDRNNTGFTLIELLVALAMVAVIVSMVYGSYAATSKSLEVYDSRLDCSQRAQLALRFMTRQIRCAYAPAEPNHAASLSAQAGQMPVMADPTWIKESVPVFRGDSRNGRGEILQFMTTAGLGGGPTASQTLSSTRYRYDRATGTLSIDLGAGAGPFDPRGSNSRWRLLLDRVESVDLAFHDGRQWQQKWDFAQQRRLPRAVRINLTVVDERGRDHQVGTTASIGHRASRPQQASEQTSVDKR